MSAQPAGFTDAEWTRVDSLETEFSGPVPPMRRKPGAEYGEATQAWKHEALKTSSIIVKTLSEGHQKLFFSRGMGTRCLVRTVEGSGASRLVQASR